MYVALLVMIAGIIAGRLLRNRVKLSLSPIIMAVISLLLFVLGVELGLNENLISQFSKLGLSAIVISILSVLGSCIAAFVFYKLTVGKKEKDA